MRPHNSPQISLLRAFARPMSVLLALLLWCGSAHATTYVVNSLADADPVVADGQITLREAITAANTNAASGDAPAGGAADTINFGVTGTIRLLSDLPFLSGTLTIANTQAGEVVISADSNGDGMPNDNAEAVLLTNNSSNITLEKLTLSDAADSALYIGNSDALIRNCTIRNSTSSDGGGAIYSVNSRVTIENCNIVGNKIAGVNQGAGIYNTFGALTINNSNISGNTAGDDSQGGGLFNSNGTIVISNTTFSGNTAGDDGGAIYNRKSSPSNAMSATMTLNNCTFSGNTVGIVGGINSTSDGGAIFNLSGTLNINGGSISGNEATGSGGALVSGNILNLDGVTIGGNKAGDNDDADSASDGGGIEVSPGATATMTNCTFSGNSAANQGGGIRNGGTLTLTSSTFTGNSAVNSAGGEGGGIYSRGGTLTVDRCTLRGNTASSEGGGLNNIAGKATITASTFSGNSTSSTAGSSGGAIYSETSSDFTTSFTRLINCTLSGNSAPIGAGIANFNGLVGLQSATVTANNASNTGGGIASFGDTDTSTRLANSIVAGNSNGDVVFAEEPVNSLASDGNNLIGNGNATGNFNAGGDATGVTNPQLGSLSNNGGPTQTHLPQNGSPAIDKGATDLEFDQRGFARPVGAADDIGAVESGAAPSGPISFGISLTPKAPKTNDTLTATPVVASQDAGTTFSYEFRVNDVSVQNGASNTLDLSVAGNGDKGDVVSVTATATGGRIGTATNSVTVINSAPTAQNASGAANDRQQISVPVSGADADGDPITFKRVGGPRNGTGEFVTESGITSFRYQSRARFDGEEIIRFVALDNTGKPSNIATITIAVTNVTPIPNRNPTAESFTFDSLVNTSEVIGLRGSDPDGDPLTFRLVNNARFGRSDIRRDGDGQFKLFYTSLNRFYGDDRVTYIAIDDKGRESRPATITIRFGNRAPVAQDGRIGVASGQSVSQYLFAPDPDKDALTFRLVSAPMHGQAEIKRDAQGQWRVFYSADADYVGPDSLTFIATDARGAESGLGTIRVRVDAPVAPSGAGALRVAPDSAPSGGSS